MRLYQCMGCKRIFVTNKMHIQCPDCYYKMEFENEAVFICELPNGIIEQREDCKFL